MSEEVFILLPGLCGGLLGILASLVMIAGGWKMFVKAGQPGWAVLVPLYNAIIFLKIVGRPTWWVVLTMIPFVNTVIVFILNIDMAKSFGKGVGFGIFMALFPAIGVPMLGFGSAQYQGPSASG